METITFENLPKAVTNLTREIGEIKELLLKKHEQQLTPQSEQFLTIQEAAKLFNLTVPTMYSKVSKGELPVMKRGKRLYFSRNELLEYLKEGRKNSNSEIEKAAENYLASKNNAGL